MSTPKTRIVKGADVAPGMVVKFGGRWLRVASWYEISWPADGVRWALTVKHDHDARLADVTRPGSLRMVSLDGDYLTRDQGPAPVWDWVTKRLARERELRG